MKEVFHKRQLTRSSAVRRSFTPQHSRSSFREADDLTMAGEMEYSEKYEDDLFEYRHVICPREMASQFPKGRLMEDAEWRALGVTQSRGWMHYAVHKPEPHILLFRRPFGTKSGSGKAPPHWGGVTQLTERERKFWLWATNPLFIWTERWYYKRHILPPIILMWYVVLWDEWDDGNRYHPLGDGGGAEVQIGLFTHKQRWILHISRSSRGQWMYSFTICPRFCCVSIDDEGCFLFTLIDASCSSSFPETLPDLCSSSNCVHALHVQCSES